MCCCTAGYVLQFVVLSLDGCTAGAVLQVVVPALDGRATLIMDLGLFKLSSAPRTAAALPSDEAAVYECFTLHVRFSAASAVVHHPPRAV